jgi:transposase
VATFVRALTDVERAKVERLTRARTAPVRLAWRAWIVELSGAGMSVPAIAARLGLGEKCIRLWVQRFNERGLDGLEDAPRSGRPRTYGEEAYSGVVAMARSRPPPPGGAVPPTRRWTLDRLQEELAKNGLPIKRSQIRRILRAERVEWQKARTRPGSDDPQFAEKRGSSSSSPPRPRSAARSSTSTSGARSRPRTPRARAGRTTPTARTSTPTTRGAATAGSSAP